MSNKNDFILKEGWGWLKKYTGTDEEVIIPECVKKLDFDCFGNNPTIKKVIISDNVTECDSLAFYDNDQLEAILVSENNPSFCSIDGILFTKDKKTLVKYPGGRKGEYTVPDGVETIASCAFYESRKITAVHLPESLLRIEGYAFMGCDCITYMEIPANVQQIIHYPSSIPAHVESITVHPDNPKYTSIDGLVFSKTLRNLQFCPREREGEVVLPEQVTGINASAFEGCSKITNIVFPEKLSKIGTAAFKSCSSLEEVNLPSKVTAIEADAFSGCTNLKRITILGKIKVIQNSTFLNCKSLSYVELPQSLLRIESESFHGCESLEEITLPSSVEAMGKDIFPKETVVTCSSAAFKLLPTVTKETICRKYFKNNDYFPESLAEKIVDYFKRNKSILIERFMMENDVEAFSRSLDYVKLTNAVIEEYLELSSRYDKAEFRFAILERTTKKDKNLPKRDTSVLREFAEKDGKLYMDSKEAKQIFRISETAKGIVIYGYKGKDAKVTIPNQIADYLVVEIKDGAFSGNTTLEEVILPESIEKIGDAFENCLNLKKINFPASLKELGNTSFKGCKNLQKVNIPSTLKKIGEQTFTDCPSFADENGFVVVNKNLYGYHGSEKKVIIPKGVKVIAPLAFNKNHKLEEVIFPASLKTICSEAFTDCRGMKTVSLPGKVHADPDAFSDCVIKEAFIPLEWAMFYTGIFSKNTQIDVMHINNPDIHIYSIGNHKDCIPRSICSAKGSRGEAYAVKKGVNFIEATSPEK